MELKHYDNPETTSVSEMKAIFDKKIADMVEAEPPIWFNDWITHKPLELSIFELLTLRLCKPDTMEQLGQRYMKILPEIQKKASNRKTYHETIAAIVNKPKSVLEHYHESLEKFSKSVKDIPPTQLKHLGN